MIFSSHRKKLDPRRRFGTRTFQDKIKTAASYKRMFNPSNGFSLKFLPSSGRKAKIAVLSGLAVFLLGFYYFTMSEALLVTDVTVTGNHQVSTQQIFDVLDLDSDARLFLIKKNNYFLMSQGRLNQVLTSAIPTIKSIVSFKKTWPNKVRIEITEHTPAFVVESDNNYFLVDDEGVVVNQIDNPGKLIIAHDQLVETFARDEALPGHKLAPFIISMNKLWNTKISTPIAWIKFPGKSSNEVEFVTSLGWSVMFDTARSVTVQLSDLTVILSKQIKPSEQANLAYIDLRLSKWAYYCFKASPCQQQAKPTEAGGETNVQE